MVRILTLLMLLTFIFCGPAYCHTFEVIRTSESSAEVILCDRATGEEWVVEVGDEIDGYRIIKITPSYVTIAKPGENRVVFLTKIPIKGEHRITKVSP